MTALTLPAPISILPMFSSHAVSYDTCSMTSAVTSSYTAKKPQCKFGLGQTGRRQLKKQLCTAKENMNQHRINSRQLAKQRRAKQLLKRRKQFRFASSAKTHDGISPENAQLQRLVLDFWSKDQSLDLLVELLDKLKQDDLSRLASNLTALLHRVKQCPGKASTALLPRGGGRAVKLSKAHIPHLSQLQTYTIKVRDECVRRCEAAAAAAASAALETDIDCDLDLFLLEVPDFDA